jgi:hypothetical protein
MPAVVAYLDAGTGAAIAAVVASGAVGVRAVLVGAKDRFRRTSDRPAPDETVAPLGGGRSADR